MGRPKLLLPARTSTIIERVLAAWTASRVTRTIVVVRRDDAELAARCRMFDVDVVMPPSPPADMKASIVCALDYIASRHSPVGPDAWLVAPADMPHLSTLAIDRVLNAFDPARPTPIIPVFRGQRGHPVLLPWHMARLVKTSAPGEGLNALMARAPSREIECQSAGILVDLDTPAEYQAFTGTGGAPCLLETDHRAAGF